MITNFTGEEFGSEPLKGLIVSSAIETLSSMGEASVKPTLTVTAEGNAGSHAEDGRMTRHGQRAFSLFVRS
jgi:hypothetical protein